MLETSGIISSYMGGWIFTLFEEKQQHEMTSILLFLRLDEIRFLQCMPVKNRSAGLTVKNIKENTFEYEFRCQIHIK